MAFEVFDDAAFYYFLLTVIAMVLTPWTMSKLCDTFGICQDDDEEVVKKVDEVGGYYQEQRKSVDEDDSKPKLFRCSNIVFFLLWAIILLIVIKLPGSGESFQTFNPFEILEVDVGVSDRDIKKAYRKLSLKYHPDKNPGDEVAAKQFILVSKAYQTLTDPQTKKNWEEYGNPDGYQGTSVTIGLPSFLTDKNNEFQVLFVYFIIIIIVPPILVFMWWKNAKEKGPEGIMHKSIQFYYHMIDKNWSINMVNKFTSLYASSAEFEPMLDKLLVPSKAKLRDSLKKEVEEFGKKVEFPGKGQHLLNHPRIEFGSLLLQAHMRRVKIPEEFRKELDVMLKKIDTLIPAMLGTTWRYGKTAFAMPCLSVIKFNQLLVQAMWAHESVFKQLPHECAEAIRKGGKNRISTWDSYFNLTEEKKKKKLFNKYEEDHIKDIEKAASQIPQVEMNWKYGVEGEKQIYTNDFVTVDIRLFRRGEYEENKDEGKLGKEEKNKPEADKEKNGGAKDNEGKAEGEIEDESDYEDELIDEWAIVEEQKSNKKEKKKKRQALAPFYPGQKYEKWYILLVSAKTPNNKLVMDVQSVDLDDMVETSLRFKAPEKEGEYKYEIQAFCDSYVGCDFFYDFQISVEVDKNRKTDADYEKEKEDLEKEEELEMKKWEEEYPPQWYYCYYTSFGEMVLNAFVFALLCVFIFNFLHSRGYWQDYVQPVIDTTYNATCTYVYDLEPFFNPPEKIEDEFADIGGGDAEM
mmetsp:Transcript_19002/g.30925  ORF Transcript_19002/g.30925 Transcript_19002/m.30925 type:complete len:743 (-) Transcript_19002:252-2480(-)